MDGLELIEIADKLDQLHATFERDHGGTLRAEIEAVKPFVRAWSGSNIGFHSCVYYRDFQPPPSGARFSGEWGFLSRYNYGTAGDWCEYDRDDGVELIHRGAGSPNLGVVREASDELKGRVEDALTIAADEHAGDAYLRQLHDRAAKVRSALVNEFNQAMLPLGQFITRDSVALGQGIRTAPHQQVAAEMAALGQASLNAKTSQASRARRARIWSASVAASGEARSWERTSSSGMVARWLGAPSRTSSRTGSGCPTTSSTGCSSPAPI